MPELWQIGMQLLLAGAIYGGIRADLKNAKECAQEAKTEAGKAHKRIDAFLLKGAK